MNEKNTTMHKGKRTVAEVVEDTSEAWLREVLCPALCAADGGKEGK